MWDIRLRNESGLIRLNVKTIGSNDCNSIQCHLNVFDVMLFLCFFIIYYTMVSVYVLICEQNNDFF